MKLFHGHNHGLKPTVVGEDSGEITCSVCELDLSGEFYSCTKKKCDFTLHKSCFELPKKFKHKSHPEHAFSLISEAPEHSLYYYCNACGDTIEGFAFDCGECDYSMHVKCALLPESVECKAHEHDLQLYYTTSKANIDGYTFFRCDVCDEAVTEGYWTYYCKDCDFVADFDCARTAEAVKEKEEEEEEEEEQDEGEGEEEGEEEELPIALQLARARISMENQRMNLEFQMQMARRNAQCLNGLANSWRTTF